MQSTFFMPPINMMGAGCIAKAVQQISDFGIHKCLIVTDVFLSESVMMGRLKMLLNRHDVDTIIFPGPYLIRLQATSKRGLMYYWSIIATRLSLLVVVHPMIVQKRLRCLLLMAVK